jgi:hypothetical protein
MPSQKLVRCYIRPAGASRQPTPRFVPLEIFGLWEFLMTRKHGFEILEPNASLWLDAEDAPDAAYGETQYDRVTEVTAFIYSGRDGMFSRACRYFPSNQCAELKEIFLSHYRDRGEVIGLQVRERQGIWLHREVAAEPVAA